MGSPRPGISTPLPPVGAGVGVAPDEVGAGLSDGRGGAGRGRGGCRGLARGAAALLGPDRRDAGGLERVVDVRHEAREGRGDRVGRRALDGRLEQEEPEDDREDQEPDDGQHRLEEPGRQDRLLEHRPVEGDRQAALRRHEQLERPGLGLAAPEALLGADLDLREARHPGLDDDGRRVDVELELAGRRRSPRSPPTGGRCPGCRRRGRATPSASPGRSAGTSSACGSWNAPTVTEPSSTAEPAGSSRERARSPNGTRPDGVDAARGGANTTLASPSAPGNRLRDGGATRRPARGVAQDVERELVDDGPGVADLDGDGDGRARLDGDRRRDQRDGGTHGRKCNDR